MLTEIGVDVESMIVYDMNHIVRSQDVRLYNVSALDRNLSFGDIDFNQLPFDRSEGGWH
jgi:hypothetical protein